MSAAKKKISLADIYVQSIQKDNAFLKEKVSALQKDMEALRQKSEEERKKQQQEKIALQDDLSKMVRDISSLRNENSSLKEEIREYDECYVPADGSQKLKDSLAETRQTLRETIEKYNEMVDSYDAAREKCASACIEADALRNDNETMKGELNKIHMLYQASAKELEQNRNDMGDMMKEMAELHQALAQQESDDAQPSLDDRRECEAGGFASSSDRRPHEFVGNADEGEQFTEEQSEFSEPRFFVRAERLEEARDERRRQSEGAVLPAGGGDE